MKYLVGILIISFVGIVLTTGCDDTKKPLRPTALRLVDTLVAQEWRIVELQMDSSCTANQPYIFERAYDSIYQIRLVEKQELIQYEVH